MSNILFYEPFYNFDCLSDRALRPLSKHDTQLERSPTVFERVFRPKYADLSSLDFVLTTLRQNGPA